MFADAYGASSNDFPARRCDRHIQSAHISTFFQSRKMTILCDPIMIIVCIIHRQTAISLAAAAADAAEFSITDKVAIKPAKRSH